MKPERGAAPARPGRTDADSGFGCQYTPSGYMSLRLVTEETTTEQAPAERSHRLIDAEHAAGLTGVAACRAVLARVPRRSVK